QPYMVALMTEVLCAGGRDKILEIGTGSGYQAAVLAETCREVYTIERKEHLLDNARETLSGAGYGNIFFKCADGTKGWEEKAPFDGIIVTAAAPGIPESLKDQLADGGRLVMPVGPRFSQVLVAVDREGSSFTEENICGCVFVPLIGDEGCDG
ncbi:MAG: protein-L-isoaspartate(D-aspartate) O-methyltransferase, partial [Candidatus Omnitrophica bacterium]|nr:protein-L-isoaspartate(D-aspartate) O-methyltransferase [Candidatus Omnitrophota bacterium]